MSICFVGGQAAAKSLTHMAPCAFVADFVTRELKERKGLYAGKVKRDLKKALSQHELEWEMPFAVNGQSLAVVSNL